MANQAGSHESTSFCPPERRIHVLVAAILASSMGFIDGSVIAIATPAIRADLGATLADVQWVNNAYLLLLASLLLVGGAAGDRFGVRRTFGIGILLFVAASVVCALAANVTLLIGARALQGIGAALMVPGSLAIIAKAYPRDQRGRAIGIWASASSLTTIAGPILGGLVLTSLGDWSWRLVFAINLPLGGAALALLYFRVPPDLPDQHRRLDTIGGGLATAGLLLLALAFTGFGQGVPAVSHVLAYGASGGLVLLAFLWWESRAGSPMLPLRQFRNPAFSGAQGLTFALYFGLAAVLFFLPMTMIAGWGVTAAEVAIVLLPVGIAITVMSPWAGRLADRIGARPMITAGSLVVGLAFALLGLTAPLESPWLAVLPSILLLGIGMGLVVSPLSTAVMTSVADSDTGMASGVNNAVARVAGLFAVALMGGVAAMVFEQTLGSAAELQLFFGVAPSVPLDGETENIRRAATNAAFAAVAYANAVLAVVAAAIAWLALEPKLSSPQPRSSAPDRAP